MDYLSLIGISLGLSCDAFAVSVSESALHQHIKIRYAFAMAFFFGLFQAVMPVLGWIIGKTGETVFRNTQRIFGFGVLTILGIKMLWDYYDNRKHHAIKIYHSRLSWTGIIILAVATSIDAFACGIILPVSIGADTAWLMTVAVGIIGGITFVISLGGIYIGKFFGTLFSDYAELFGGIILIVIGIKILILS